MPFAVFRRHQRKLLAIFAILAMFGFVLADSLPRLLSGGYVGGNGDPVVVDALRQVGPRQRHQRDGRRAEPGQPFLAELSAILYGVTGPPVFGDVTSTRALVDALILQHEADALKMPGGSEAAKEWLKQVTGGKMTRELFEATLRGLATRSAASRSSTTSPTSSA